MKYYHDLNWLQKVLIKRWFKKNKLHTIGLQAINATDVINLWSYELLFSFYNDNGNRDRYIDLFDRHKENYILYQNVIFIL